MDAGGTPLSVVTFRLTAATLRATVDPTTLAHTVVPPASADDEHLAAALTAAADAVRAPTFTCHLDVGNGPERHHLEGWLTPQVSVLALPSPDAADGAAGDGGRLAVARTDQLVHVLADLLALGPRRRDHGIATPATLSTSVVAGLLHGEHAAPTDGVPEGWAAVLERWSSAPPRAVALTVGEATLTAVDDPPAGWWLAAPVEGAMHLVVPATASEVLLAVTDLLDPPPSGDHVTAG